MVTILNSRTKSLDLKASPLANFYSLINPSHQKKFKTFPEQHNFNLIGGFFILITLSDLLIVIDLAGKGGYLVLPKVNSSLSDYEFYTINRLFVSQLYPLFPLQVEDSAFLDLPLTQTINFLQGYLNFLVPTEPF